MRRNQIRWLLLLVVILAILGAIQCPTSPKRKSSGLKSFGKSFARKLTGGRNGSASRSRRSGSGGAGDNAGSESDMDQPASGTYGGSGSGRAPRSRSSSPPVGGGGRARSSSSSNEPPIVKMDAGFNVDRITNRCRVVNEDGDAHVVRNMQVTFFVNIINEMRRVVANDLCKTFERGPTGGSAKCQDMYSEFKKIPSIYRGECSDAISANCIAWYGGTTRNYQNGKKICAFFIKKSMRSHVIMEGHWISLADCIRGIKEQLFMDHQLSSVGINPPSSPPQPLLPPNYSPDH